MFVLRCTRSVFNTRARRMSVYSRWWKEIQTVLFIFIIAHLQFVCCADDVLSRHDHSKTPQAGRYRLAEITISYKDPKFQKTQFKGKFAINSVINEVKGTVVYAISSNETTSNHFGCSKYDNKIPSGKWIALVERGECNFSRKVSFATRTHNATAVIVYDWNPSKTENKNKNTAFPNAVMNQGVKGGTSVFISHKYGRKMVSILERGSSITMHILPGDEVPFDQNGENNISKTSVLFVSISFIILMIISLAWLVFYYIQRFRYSHAKERLARRLAFAAKKAIAKIPQNTVKSGDRVLDGDHDQCAICIEQYKPHDVIRTLPCTHVFHKSCVDPWLQENRSCPMCKMDILAAYGMQIGTSQESVHHNTEPGPTSQMVIEDPEVSSSMEEARNELVLLPPICLHFNTERDNDAEDPQPSSQLLGSSDKAIHLSSTSLHSNNNANSSGNASFVSRAERRDIEESTIKEIKALIEKEFHCMKSDCEDDDEDNDNKQDCVSKDNVSGGHDMIELSETACGSDYSSCKKDEYDGSSTHTLEIEEENCVIIL